MKFILAIVFIVIIGGLGLYSHFPKNEYVKSSEEIVAGGHFFDNAQTDKKIVYEKNGNRYLVTISEFNNKSEARESFMEKIEHYKLNNRNNSEKLLENGVYMFRGNNGAGAFFISFNKQNIDVEINLLEGGSEDEFANWLIKNY